MSDIETLNDFVSLIQENLKLKDENGRKDAAIAELRLALERIYTSHYAAPEILRGIARDAIAKYDTSTKGAA